MRLPPLPQAPTSIPHINSHTRRSSNAGSSLPSQVSTLLFILLASNANIGHVLSSPISSRDTKEETVHWVSGPDTRGTFELLLNCIVTLLLCMWTSLHLNIPCQGETVLKQATMKFLWTLLALFAPEIVVFCAWRQWISAKSLSKQMDEIINNKPKSDGPKHPWTMTHSFFATMGGFTFEVDNGETKFIETELSHIPLTAPGVLLLAKCGYIPDISEAAIMDKSKADGLAKTLVCVQAGWCLLQYIGRLASHLPVSLLELNTLGHALCAFSIYLSWWYKPLDIKEPYMLSGSLAPSPLVAYMWMSSRLSPGVLRDDRHFTTELTDLEWKGTAEGGEGKTVVDDTRVTLSLGETLFGFYLIPDGRISRALRRFDIEETVEPTVQLSAVEVRRWRLASNAVIQYEAVQSRLSDKYWYVHQEDLLQAHISNWPGSHLISSDEFYTSIMLAFISAAYGGLHASGWNHFFSSWQERLIWRISSVVIAAAGAFMSLFMVGVKIYGEWEQGGKLVRLFRMFGWVFCMFDRVLGRAFSMFGRVFDWIAIVWNNLGDFSRLILSNPVYHLGYLFYVLFLVLLVSVCVAYCFCRIFLVVEAFISLRELPAGVYITPSWSQLLPHL